MISVLVVDDHQLARSGLRSLIEAEPDLEVAGEAGTARPPSGWRDSCGRTSS